MSIGSILGGILKTLGLAALAAISVKLGDPSTFAGLGAYASFGVAIGLFLSNLLAQWLAKHPVAAKAFGIRVLHPAAKS